MAEIPDKINTIANLIDQSHEARSDKPRPHMGCSQLGHHCERYLWLSFRWAAREEFKGRILRLFRRGQLEEETVVSDLRSIGCDVRATGGKQSRVDFGCHISGSIDGIIESGLPEAPKKRHILEIKTHGKKSFDSLEKDGVFKSKPEHWAQMQLYMLGSGIDRALYYSVCKDDDRIYTERVKLDKEQAQAILERGKRIVLSDRMPEPCAGASATWYQCKFCPAYSMCHEAQPTKHVNCRTCAHVTALESGEWHCGRYDASGIPVDHQRQGCECHALHPDMVPWERKESTNPHEAVYLIEGREIRNGEPCAYCFGSKELIANLDACLGKIPEATMARETMEGTFVSDSDVPF